MSTFVWPGQGVLKPGHCCASVEGFSVHAGVQPETLEEAVKHLHKVHLARDPGAKFSYHNPNYTVLARLVEVVSHQDFANYLHANLFEPLGMRDTKTVNRVDEMRDHVPLGHLSAFGRSFAVGSPGFFVNGAGGVLTTPADYAIWLTTQMNGGVGPNGVRILSEGSVRISHTPSPTSAGYGFGWNHALDGRISHSGGLPTFGAYAALRGHKAVAVFVPVTSVMAPSQEVALTILDHTVEKPIAPIGQSGLKWWDFGLSAASFLIWLKCARGVMRSRKWATRMAGKPVWRQAAAFAPYIVIACSVIFGLPFLVSQVVSWSWIWLWYYVPVWVMFFASCAAAALIVSGSRLLHLSARLRGAQ